MVYEYAVEPEVVAAWGKTRDNFRYFIDKFGLGHPRMMSEYPGHSRWRKKFKEALSLIDDDSERKRIEELFRRLEEIKIKRYFKYDGKLSWLQNAEREHTIRCPFHAILAEDNPRKRVGVFKSSELTPDLPEWNPEKMVTVERKAEIMAEAVSPMLSNCSEAIFIDPHFGPKNRRHRLPIKAFLRELVNHRCGPSPIKIEVHTSDKATPDHFRRECRNQMEPLIPRGMTVCFKQWKEKQGDRHEKLHNRYILTNIGSVMFLVGLDQGKGSDTVTLLERKIHELIWKQYVSNPAFDLVDSIEIKGTV
ncbi:MAG TPA: hypothetical protein ENK58_03410 [Desulfobacterales bacterium]|nr:MAG: hypothetical protein DRI57_12440 [Deltaproteobacteria bacterium]HHC24451.1 hypothetical protein [Desulfobacterales bacterium]